MQRHHQLVRNLTVDSINEILTYVVNKLLKVKGTLSPSSSDQLRTGGPESGRIIAQTKKPAINLKVFYQVNSTPSIDLLIKTISDFRERIAEQTNLAFTVLPATSLNHFSTFLSIYGIRHE